MNNFNIYVLREPNSEGVRYVGLTSNPKNRLIKHIGHWGGDRTHRVCWIKSLKSRGLLPEMEVIESGLTLQDAKQKEIDYIKLFKACGARLVNRTMGGDGGLGYRHSDATKEKISQQRKGKKIHTEEWKKRIGLIHKGNKYLLGSKQSEESKMKKSLSLKEAYRIGRKLPVRLIHTEQSKKHLSEKMMGRTFSEETLNKMRHNAKNRNPLAYKKMVETKMRLKLEKLKLQ